MNFWEKMDFDASGFWFHRPEMPGFPNNEVSWYWLVLDGMGFEASAIPGKTEEIMARWRKHTGQEHDRCHTPRGPPFIIEAGDRQTPLLGKKVHG